MNPKFPYFGPPEKEECLKEIYPYAKKDIPPNCLPAYGPGVMITYYVESDYGHDTSKLPSPVFISFTYPS